MKSNFSFLEQYWPDIAEIGSDAEVYLYSDADVCVFKLRQLGEHIVSAIFTSTDQLSPSALRLIAWVSFEFPSSGAVPHRQTCSPQAV